MRDGAVSARSTTYQDLRETIEDVLQTSADIAGRIERLHNHLSGQSTPTNETEPSTEVHGMLPKMMATLQTTQQYHRQTMMKLSTIFDLLSMTGADLE